VAFVKNAKYQGRGLEARKRDIDSDLRAQQDSAGIAIHPNLPELYRKRVSKLQRALQHEATRSLVVETMRSLVDRIEVLPGRASGRCEGDHRGRTGPNPGFCSSKDDRPPRLEAAVRPCRKKRCFLRRSVKIADG
jgi:hypothetical protein